MLFARIAHFEILHTWMDFRRVRDEAMRIFLSAGEPSGDLHGSNLIREVRALHPDCEFLGFGGPKMAQAGCDLTHDMTDLAIMGFARVVPHLRQFRRLLQEADRLFASTPPDAVVLIDYPGFNWWVARAAKRYGIPVFYFGTPQIWAWATHRVRKLRRLVDHSLCKLPFEPEWYRSRGCEATYVGHPYFDDFVGQQLDASFLATLDERPLLTVLPGSRRHEVENNLPAFLRTIERVQERVSNVQVAIASYNPQQAQRAREMIMEYGGAVRPSVHVDRTRELIHQATCCLACSGSVSLELLHEAKPTVIHYKTDWFGDLLQRCFRRCKFITLVNLLQSERRFAYRDAYDPNEVAELEEAPFPEYLTVRDRSTDMADHLVRWLSDCEERDKAVARLEPLRREFVKSGASRMAARYIMNQMVADDTEALVGFPQQKVA